MMNWFGKVRWALFDCLNGQWVWVEKLPFEIGSGNGVDLRLNGDGILEKHCSIHRIRGLGLCLVRKSAEAELVLDGQPVDRHPLKPGAGYALRIGRQLWVLRGGRRWNGWRERLESGQWEVTNGVDAPDEAMTIGELCELSHAHPERGDDWVRPSGMDIHFRLEEVWTACGLTPTDREVIGGNTASLDRPEGATERWNVEIPDDEGRFTCPVCWLKFDEGDVMHVAVHESLRGDPVLGEDVPQRFQATRFNNRGHAIDAFGLPCPDMACPHCRRTLPSGFLEVPQHIFSIVGDQSAGKSYYLSVLVKVLPVSLFREFGVRFQDADPTGNAPLNDMKKTLFSAESPAEARLAKTQLEGAMYEQLPRFGRTVALPKPFVFFIQSLQSDSRCSAIFYDNAGEHFQPGRDSADSPGAQHVASSSGILFLLDPFNSPEFRRRIAGRADPQLEQPVVDQQDIILAELKVRLVKLLRLEIGRRVETPLAVMVGKCDVWMHLLGDAPLRNPLHDGKLHLREVQENSVRVRELLMEICPSVVANAESISSQVLYFPVSSFGHSPVKIAAGEYVPDPKQLRPILVEIPPLWILSRILPNLVATF